MGLVLAVSKQTAQKFYDSFPKKHLLDSLV